MLRPGRYGPSLRPGSDGADNEQFGRIAGLFTRINDSWMDSLGSADVRFRLSSEVRRTWTHRS